MRQVCTSGRIGGEAVRNGMCWIELIDYDGMYGSKVFQQPVLFVLIQLEQQRATLPPVGSISNTFISFFWLKNWDEFGRNLGKCHTLAYQYELIPYAIEILHHQSFPC